jgi:hypothetical protein
MQMAKKMTYNLQSVADGVCFDIVLSIPIFKVWYDNKQSVIQLICPKEF